MSTHGGAWRAAMWRSVVVVLGGVMAACGPPSQSAGGLSIVTTTAVLAALVEPVAGELADVQALMPAGSDSHGYQPMAQQRRDLLDADLVVVNGGDLEEGLLDVVAAAASEGAPVVEALDAVAPLHYDNGDLDPHFWHDTDRAARFVRSIAEQMAALKPEQAATFRAAADDYATELERLGTEIDSLLEPVPAAERLLVTNHDAYRYFAERFGFQIVGTIIPGRSTQASPSAAHLAELVSLMLERHIRVVFTEDEGSLAVPEMLAAEVGPDVEVLRLSSGTLPDGYADMLRTNASRIADALACRATTGRSTWNG